MDELLLDFEMSQKELDEFIVALPGILKDLDQENSNPESSTP